MLRSFTKSRHAWVDPTPNLRDAINNLSIPPIDQVFYQPQQPSTHGDSAIPVSSSTAQEQIQGDSGQVLQQQRRRGRVSSFTCIGHDQVFNQVCDFLRDDEVGMVGIYGMGGVGKTTLMKKLCKDFLEALNFKVVWIVVSKSIDVDKIQKAIMKEMKLPFDQDEHPYQRAQQISKALNQKRVALLFDDIWKLLDLEELEILCLDDLDTSICKIVFTTRSEKVCNQMQPDRKVKVECLGWVDSWALFEKSVGKETLDSCHNIECIAKEVARECKGLPLALTVIGQTMTCKYTLAEWKHALTTLQNSPSNNLDAENSLFARLKLSYDTLPDRGEKVCFLYCCLYPEDEQIDSHRLVKFWIAEGFLTLTNSYDETFNRGCDIIGTLLAACLLERSGDEILKMHDIIRDMGLWILSKMKLKFFVHGGSQLTKAQISDQWRHAHRIYVLKKEELPEEPHCLNLTTLIVSNSCPKMKISNEFFKSMCAMRVLHLQNVEFTDLPVAIGQLLELRYLHICETNLETLPAEIGNLNKLEVLHVNGNKNLIELPKTIGQLIEIKTLTVDCCRKALPGELGNLDKLESLSMELPDSDPVGFINWLKQLSHSLRCLSITCRHITGGGGDELLSALQEMDKLLVLGIAKFPLEEFSVLTSSCLSNLEELRLILCRQLEKIQVGQLDLQNLWKLEIVDCNSLKHIGGLQHLRGLVELTIHGGHRIEDLIKAGEEVKEGRHMCFRRLKSMTIGHLRNLKSISSDAVSFPSITQFELYACPQLKKLPRGLMNVNKTLKIGYIYGTRWWWDKLVWDDDHFKPFIETTLRVSLGRFFDAPLTNAPKMSLLLQSGKWQGRGRP